MLKKFKEPLYIRVVLIVVTCVSSFEFLSDNGDLYTPLFFIVFLLLAVNANFTVYLVSSEELIIKKPLARITIHKLSDIKRIEEPKWLLPYLKIFFSTRKRPLLFQTNNMGEFVEAILESLKDTKTFEFDQNEKWINFSPL